MEIKIERADAMTIEEFADKHGLVMKCVERERWICSDDNKRWLASFERVEESQPGVLIGIYGNGPTPEAAIADYARQLPGKKLVVDAYKDTRRKIYVEDIIPTPSRSKDA